MNKEKKCNIEVAHQKLIVFEIFIESYMDLRNIYKNSSLSILCLSRKFLFRVNDAKSRFIMLFQN